jgi:hypothetical protein
MVFTFLMVWCMLLMLGFVPTDQVEEGSLFLQKLAMAVAVWVLTGFFSLKKRRKNTYV